MWVLILKFAGDRNMLIMEIAELRVELHKMIDKITDGNVLSAVLTLLSGKAATHSDWWDTISDQEKEAINLGLRQLDDGQGIPHEEVRKKVDKILGRR
jgi:predicted transcriptional regulator